MLSSSRLGREPPRVDILQSISQTAVKSSRPYDGVNSVHDRMKSKRRHRSGISWVCVAHEETAKDIVSADRLDRFREG